MELKGFFEHIQLIKIKSVVDQLWKVGLIILGMTVVSSMTPNLWLTIALFVLSCVFFAFGLVSWAYFAIKDPTLLRSEEHELRRKALELLGDKDKKLNPIDLQNVIENPFFNALSEAQPIEKEEEK